MDEQNEKKVEQEEIGLYEKLASRTADLLEEGKKTFDEALKKAKEELSSAGDFSREQADKLGEYVRRDLKENAGKAKNAVKKAVEPQRLAAGVQSAFSRILTSAAETLTELAERSRSPPSSLPCGAWRRKGCSNLELMIKPRRRAESGVISISHLMAKRGSGRCVRHL